MLFFMKQIKKKFDCKRLAGALLACVMLTASVMQTEAADFRHKHGSSCYTQGTVACSAVHKQYTRPESTTAYCDNCGTQTSQTLTVRWELCEGNGDTYELGGYRNCGICGSRTYEWNHSAWNHERTGEVLTCKKGTAVTGTLWIASSTSDWTTGNVLLEVGVKIVSNELSLAKEPFSWDNKATWTTEKQREVTENGIYTIYAKNSGGSVISEKIEVTNIDRTGPKLSAVEKSTEEWTNQDVVVTVSGEDVQPEGTLGCGLADEPYSFDGGATYVAGNTLTVSENGTYDVLLADRLGNTGTGTIEVTNIDKKAPVIVSVNPLNEGWQRESVTVGVNAADAEGGSGLHSEAYSLDGGITWQGTTDFVIAENGVYRVQVRDFVGNVAEREFLVNQMDVTAPVIEELKVSPDKIFEDKVFVTIVAKDMQPDGTEGSGLHNEAYSLDGGLTWQAENGFWAKKGQNYDVRVRDSLEWESGEKIVTRNHFPYPKPEISEDDSANAGNGQGGTGENPGGTSGGNSADSGTESGKGNDTGDSQNPENGKGNRADSNTGDKNKDNPDKKADDDNICDGNPDGMYDYGRWYEHRDESLDETGGLEDENGRMPLKEDSTTVMQENLMSGNENQAQVIRLPWYTTPIGRAFVVSALALAAGVLLGGLFLLLVFSVPVYCVEKKQCHYLGRVLLHRTNEGYSVFLSGFMLQTATIPKYRIKISGLLLKRVENARLLVQSEEKNLEVLMQETIDFEL